MPVGDQKLETILEAVEPIELPPSEYPPAVIVRDTPPEEMDARIKANAEKAGIELTDKHWEVIHFLLDFYRHCCEMEDPGYLQAKIYWDWVRCHSDPDCLTEEEKKDKELCKYGQLSPGECTKGYRIYRILLKAFKDKGGKRYLYGLFPYGPVFTIHLLAQLPRLINDADPHFGTAY